MEYWSCRWQSRHRPVPISLTASLRLDDVSLDHQWGGILRGYSELFFRGDYDQIVHGPETHYEGLIAGPRYNFVQPGWQVILTLKAGLVSFLRMQTPAPVARSSEPVPQFVLSGDMRQFATCCPSEICSDDVDQF